MPQKLNLLSLRGEVSDACLSLTSFHPAEGLVRKVFLSFSLYVLREVKSLAQGHPGHRCKCNFIGLPSLRAKSLHSRASNLLGSSGDSQTSPTQASRAKSALLFISLFVPGGQGSCQFSPAKSMEGSSTSEQPRTYLWIGFPDWISFPGGACWPWSHIRMSLGTGGFGDSLDKGSPTAPLSSRMKSRGCDLFRLPCRLHFVPLTPSLTQVRPHRSFCPSLEAFPVPVAKGTLPQSLLRVDP